METAKKIKLYVSRSCTVEGTNSYRNCEELIIQTSLDMEEGKYYCSTGLIYDPDSRDGRRSIRELLISAFKRISETNDSEEELNRRQIEIEFNQNQYSIFTSLVFRPFTTGSPQSFLRVGAPILLKKPVKEKDIERVMEGFSSLRWGTERAWE